MKYANNIGDLIGNTPLLKIDRLMKKENVEANIFAKLEAFNPAGSVKDRIGWAMLEEAEKAGQINKDTVIIEPTSGNTGIGLALASRVMGYKLILTMPESMSKERRDLLKAYGAELVLTPAKEGMAGAVNKANELKNEYDNSFIPSQFDNKVNSNTHIKTTAEEIWRDTDGKVDILVATFGTGGTVTGTSKGLKAHNPNIQVYGVEPASSPLLTKGVAGPHKIQGIGANFVPNVLEPEYVDEFLTVTDEDAYKYGKMFGQYEGMLCGISSGAALAAAIEIGKRPENKGKNIVVILPDGGEKYLSTGIFD